MQKVLCVEKCGYKLGTYCMAELLGKKRTSATCKEGIKQEAQESAQK